MKVVNNWIEESRGSQLWWESIANQKLMPKSCETLKYWDQNFKKSLRGTENDNWFCGLWKIWYDIIDMTILLNISMSHIKISTKILYHITYLNLRYNIRYLYQRYYIFNITDFLVHGMVKLALILHLNLLETLWCNKKACVWALPLQGEFSPLEKPNALTTTLYCRVDHSMSIIPERQSPTFECICAWRRGPAQRWRREARRGPRRRSWSRTTCPCRRRKRPRSGPGWTRPPLRHRKWT